MDDPRSPHPPRVLVAYATAAGSTAGVAEHIAEALRDDGAVATCRAVDADLDPAPFDAIVVGSAVHNMAWLPPALDFVRRLPEQTPLWCFSVAGADPHGRRSGRLATMEAGRLRAGLPPGTTPVEHRLFGGVVSMEGVPLWGRVFYRVTGQRAGDHRDWPGIEAWAHGIGRALSDRTASSRRTRP